MDALPEDNPALDALVGGVAWFHVYAARLESQPPALPLRCPCCGCKTLGERGGFEICEVCFWEDDGQDDHDTDVVRGGPNGSLSLTQARVNYRQFGACDARSVGNVRPPHPEEVSEQKSAAPDAAPEGT